MANGAGQAISKTPVPEADWQDYKPDEQGWEDFKPQAQARSPNVGAYSSGDYQNRKGGPILNVNKTPVRTAVEAAEKNEGISREPTSLLDAVKQSGGAALDTIGSVIKDPLNAGKLIDQIGGEFEGAAGDAYQGIKRNDPRSVAHAAGRLAPLAAPEAINDGGTLASKVARDAETGSLKPGAKTFGKTAGMVGGYAAGTTVGHPYLGGMAGRDMGPKLLDMIIPDREVPVSEFPSKRGGNGASLPDAGDFYEHRGADLMKRGKETRLIDKLKEQGEGGTGKVTVLPEGKQGSGPLTPEQVPGKPQLRRLAQGGESRAGKELQRRGETVVYKSTPDYSERRERINLKDAVSDSQEPSGGRPVSRKGQNLPKDSADRMAERTGASRGQLEREQAEAERATKRTLRQNIEAGKGQDTYSIKPVSYKNYPKGEKEAGGVHYKILDNQGKDTGATIDGGIVNGKITIDWIGHHDDPEFAPGPRALRDVMDQLKKNHPGVKTIEWNRVSGSHAEKGTARGSVNEGEYWDKVSKNYTKTPLKARGSKLIDKITPESSGAQRASEISPMNPQERADLEKQAGKKFESDAEAYDYRRKAAEWTGNQALAKGKVDTDVKQSTGLRDVQKKAGYGKKNKTKN